MDTNKILDDLGGTSAVADLCGLTTGAVSQWRTNGIPQARLMYLKLLRPDVFACELVTTDHPVPVKRAA